MWNIVWKSFRSNIRNFLVFFISVIMTVNVLFLMMYIQEAVARIKNVDNANLFQYASALGKMMRTIIPAIIIIAIIVITYSVRFYVQSRMKDYGMMTVLGIRRKDMRNLVVLEYTLSCGVSCILGLLLGKGISYFIGKALEGYVGKSFVNSIRMGKVYQMTAVMCILLIVGALLAIAIMLSEKDISNLIKSDVVKEKRLTATWSMLFLPGGLALVICGFIMIGISPRYAIIAVFFLCLGIVVSMGFGFGYLLECFRKSERYCKKVLVWDQFYHRFSTNKSRIIIQTILGILLIYFSFVNIEGGLNPRRMPNDFACTTGEKQDFLREFGGKYQGTEISFPFVWVNSDGGAVRVGMSVNDYNRIFQKDEGLAEEEILSFCMIEDGESMIDNAETRMTRYLSLGRDLSSANITGEEFKYRYKVKAEEKKEIIGFSMAGVVVLSDKAFSDAVKKDDFHQEFLMLNVDESQLTDATRFVEQKKNDGDLVEAYCKKTIADADKQGVFLNFSLIGVVTLAILFFSLFIMWLMMFSDMKYLIEKYQFLKIIGMRHEG